MWGSAHFNRCASGSCCPASLWVNDRISLRYITLPLNNALIKAGHKTFNNKIVPTSLAIVPAHGCYFHEVSFQRKHHWEAERRVGFHGPYVGGEHMCHSRLAWPLQFQDPCLTAIKGPTGAIIGYRPFYLCSRSFRVSNIISYCSRSRLKIAIHDFHMF